MTRQRCFGTGDPLYEAYHDEEWGHPAPDSPDERELFERIALEGFQSGLSWITVLRKRPRFREVFHDFAPAAVAAFDESARLEKVYRDYGVQARVPMLWIYAHLLSLGNVELLSRALDKLAVPAAKH